MSEADLTNMAELVIATRNLGQLADGDVKAAFSDTQIER